MKAAIALGALLLAFGPPALATDGVTSLVKGFDAEYDKAWNTLDAHKLAEEFSWDAVVLPPTRPAATGTGAVLAFLSRSSRATGPITSSNPSQRNVRART